MYIFILSCGIVYIWRVREQVVGEFAPLRLRFLASALPLVSSSQSL